MQNTVGAVDVDMCFAHSFEVQQAHSCVPRGKIPILREIVLAIGDEKCECDAGIAVVMASRYFRRPSGPLPLGFVNVWQIGMWMNPPLFKTDENGIHRVSLELLQEVRSQDLCSCSRCGMHYESHLSCWNCADI